MHRLTAVLGDRLAAGSAVVLADHRALPLAEDQLLDLGGSVAPSSRSRVTLAATGTFRGRPARDGILQLTVPDGERDQLLLAALRGGPSLRWSPRVSPPPLVPLRRAARLGLAGAAASRAVLGASFAWLLTLAAVYAAGAGPDPGGARGRVAATPGPKTWFRVPVFGYTSPRTRQCRIVRGKGGQP